MWKSDDTDDRRETASSGSERRLVEDRRCLSRLSSSAAGPMPFPAYAAAFAADRKLSVDGGCRRPAMGGRLEPCWRTLPIPRPGTVSAVPNVGVVAR